jgi:hypothetical protein
LRFESLGHTAIGEGADLPALKCSSHWSVGLYLAHVKGNLLLLHVTWV